MHARAPAAAVEAALYALLVAAPLAFGCVEPWSRGLLECGCFSLALLCLFRPERGRPSALPLLSIGVLLAVGAAQRLTPVSPLAAPPARPFTASAFATSEALRSWAACAALAWSVPRALRDGAAGRRFLRALFAAGVLVAVVGLAQRAFGTSELYGLRYVARDASPFGPYYNRDHAAGLMALSAAAGAGLWASRVAQFEGSWRAVPPDWLRAQAATAAALALLAAGLALAASRGALLGLAAAAGAIALSAAGRLSDRRRRAALHAASLGAAALALLCCYRAFAADVLASGTLEESTASRLSLYASGLRMLRDSPLFGWGLGAVGAVFGRYQTTDVVGIADHVHSDWLELALQCGLAGAGAAGALFAAFWLRSAGRWKAAASRESRALIAGALAALTVFSVHCLVDFCAQVPANAAAACALAGWLSAADRWADERPAGRGRWPRWRWALAPAFSALLLWSARPVAGAWLARRASLAPRPERARLWQEAAAWDRRPEYLFRLGAAALDDAAAEPPRERRPLLLRALEDSRRAAALEPLNPDFLALEADALHALGREAESRACAERAQRLSFEPFLPELHGAGPEEDLQRLRALSLLPDGWRTQ